MPPMDPLSDFVEESHSEEGARSELSMRKVKDGAGFCVRAKKARAARQEEAKYGRGGA